MRIGILEISLRVVVQCANEVPGLIEALCQDDGDTVQSTRDEIFRLENAADEIKNELQACKREPKPLEIMRRRNTGRALRRIAQMNVIRVPERVPERKWTQSYSTESIFYCSISIA